MTLVVSERQRTRKYSACKGGNSRERDRGMKVVAGTAVAAAAATAVYEAERF